MPKGVGGPEGGLEMLPSVWLLPLPDRTVPKCASIQVALGQQTSKGYNITLLTLKGGGAGA